MKKDFMNKIGAKLQKKSEISDMRKNQRPYTDVGLGGVENGHMVGVGGVCVTHALCSVI